ncbi:MAG: hypothetical protein ACHQTE_01800 [Candidatus Saccharimonadales bacterium]
MSIFSKQRGQRKVPEVTAVFWIIKILTTAMDEALSDYFVHQIDPVIAVAFGGLGLIIAFIIQFSSATYVPWKYWLTVSMVAVFGTMAADVLHVGLGVPYIASTLFFAIILVLVFAIWYHQEKTLSIHSISTVRREIFYWLAVIVTFALGTATGDMTAYTLGLGYVVSGIIFAILITLPAIAYFKFGLKEVIAFWTAYILTRPFGASFADWFGVPSNLGGLGLGRGWVSIVLIVLIICFVARLSVTHKGRGVTERLSS